MARWGGTGTAAQDHLVDHEFAVVLTNGTCRRLVTGIGQIRAVGPLPDLVKQAGKIRCAACRVLPFSLGRQPRAGPARVGIGFIQVDMAGRCFGVELLPASQGKGVPGFTRGLQSVQGRPCLSLVDPVPAIGQPELRTLVASVGNKGHEVGVADVALPQ